MRIYIPSPEVNQNPDVPMISVRTSDNVCSTDAYTISVPSKDNRYVAALTWTLTDDECDLLLEKLAEARGERLMRQEKAYEALHAKFAGDFDNTPVEAPRDPFEVNDDDV